MNGFISRIASSIISSSSYPKDETGRVSISANESSSEVQIQNPEGDLSVPIGEVIATLQKFLTAKYAIDIAYRNFADRVRGPWRDSLVDHWNEHSKEEREHAYDLAMKIVGLEGDPIQTIIQIPTCTSSISGFFQTLMNMELEAIQVGRSVIQMAGNMTSLKVMAENFILIDTKHLDDLKRMREQFNSV